MITVPLPLYGAAISRPEQPAVITGGASISYRALAERSARIAGALAARGIGPGSTVALAGEPGIEWVAAWHAIGATGARGAPIGLDAPIDVVQASLQRAAAELLLAAGEAPVALPHVRVSSLDAAPLAERFWPLDEPRAVISTSGSSGEPRAVELSTAQILFGAFGSAMRLGHRLDDRWLACLPLHHVGGLSILYRAALGAITVELHSRFDARAVAAALDEGRATIVSLVPVMLERVLEARPEKPFPPSLRLILLGGDRAPEALLERARALGAPVAASWGMSECASQVATSEPGAHGGALPPLPFARVRTEGDALVIEGPIAAGGRVKSGDRGELDPRGWVSVHGRRDLVFISGGEKVDPARVEAVLRAHPAVHDALVAGVPDRQWGHSTAALVAGDGERDEAQLLKWCRERLTRAEVPKILRWVDALPLGAMGKPSRSEAVRLLSGRAPALSAGDEEAA